MKYSPEKISPEKVKAAAEEMMRLGQSSNATERAKYDRLKKEAKVLREIASRHLTFYSESDLQQRTKVQRRAQEAEAKAKREAD